MSTLKRKDAPSANASSKDAKPTTETRPSKKVKSDKPGEKKTSKATEKTSSSAPAIATVKDEEPLFPRGGGSVLTPLEHKQITIEAKRDALFEEESGKPTKKGDTDSKKRKRKPSAKENKKTFDDEDAVRIEGLNYKVWDLADLLPG